MGLVQSVAMSCNLLPPPGLESNKPTLVEPQSTLTGWNRRTSHPEEQLLELAANCDGVSTSTGNVEKKTINKILPLQLR